MRAKKRILLALFFFGLLSACLSRADVSSRIEFSNVEQAEEIAVFVQESLQERIAELDGDCTTRHSDLVCNLPVADGPATVVFAGIGAEGRAFLSLQTATSHFFPVSDEKFRSGKMVPEEHQAWEQWAVKSFSQFQPQERVRSYSNNQIGPIGTF